MVKSLKPTHVFIDILSKQTSFMKFSLNLNCFFINNLSTNAPDQQLDLLR